MAALGVFGVIAYLVSQRTREIGIRIALGARLRHIRQDVLGEGAMVASIGIVLGLGASAALVGLIRSLLFGVKPFDPLSFAVVGALVAAVTILACLMPAHRASRVDPVAALRSE